MKTKNGHWISTSLLFLSALILMAIVISAISLSITQDVYAVGGMPYIGSPTPPPVGTPYPPVELPHTIELVEDIWEGDLDGTPRYFINYQDDLYFTAKDPIAKWELFQYDGSTVSIVSDLMHDGSAVPNNYVIYNGKLYFSASGMDASDNPVGRELFSYDGSTVSLIADIMPGEESSSPHKLLVHDNALYFIANGFDAENNPVGEELFKYDGSTITLVKDFEEGPGSGGSKIINIVSFENNLYYSRRFPTENRGTFKLDGTNEVLISEVIMSSNSNIEYQGALYFGAFGIQYNEVADNEFYRLDNDQIELVVDIYPGHYSSYGLIYYYSSYPDNFVLYNNEIYFSAKNDLYKFDGSTVTRVLDEFPWQGHPNLIDNVVNIHATAANSNTIFFTGNYYDIYNHARYYGIYRFDGQRIEIIDTYYRLPFGENIGVFEDNIFFSLNDGSGIGTELWMLDTDPGRVTTTTVSLDSPSTSLGDVVNVHVTVSAGDGTPLTETVEVGDGTGNNCQITLVNGSGSCSLIFNLQGNYTIYARYPWGGYYFSSSDETDLLITNDQTPPTASFANLQSGGELMLPRTWLTVNASDTQSGIQQVEFQAYYGGAWHSLFTDTDESDGWRYQWASMNATDDTINLKAIVTNNAGITTTVELNNITFTNSHNIGGGYESRGGSNDSENSESPIPPPTKYLQPNLPYPYLITPY